ncbi:hypothetical protein Tco_0412205 [Tanacetum coccineum]
MDNSMINQGVQVMPSSEQSNIVNHSETEITSDSNIIPYSQYLKETQQAAVQNSNSSAQPNALILPVIKQLKTQAGVLSRQHRRWALVIDALVVRECVRKLQCGGSEWLSKIPDSEETLMLAEESRSKMLLKQQDPMILEKKDNTKLNSMNSSDPSPSCTPNKVKVPKELPKVSMVNMSLKKLKNHLAGFDMVVKERTTTTAITEGT